MVRPRFELTDPDGSILGIGWNFSFGELMVTIFIGDENDFAGIRLSVQQAKQLIGELQEIITNQEECREG